LRDGAASAGTRGMLRSACGSRYDPASSLLLRGTLLDHHPPASRSGTRPRQGGCRPATGKGSGIVASSLAATARPAVD